MEPEYLKYLRENRPDLYKQCIDNDKWQLKWRDVYISTLEDVIFNASEEDIEGCYQQVTAFAATRKPITTHERT